MIIFYKTVLLFNFHAAILVLLIRFITILFSSWIATELDKLEYLLPNHDFFLDIKHGFF